jgi:hypothetical protein
MLHKTARLLLFAAAAVATLAAATTVSDSRYAHLARGINLTRWFQYGGRVPITAADRDMLKNAGFTSVRITLAPQYLLPKWASGRRRTRTLTNLDAGIDLFLEAGMAVMLDFHADSTYLDYYLSNPSARAELVDTWRMLAARYANRNPDLLFFEIMNEPDTRFTQADWDAEQQAALAAIREAAPNHTVLLSPARWSGLDGLLNMTPYADLNVIYVLHYYSPQTFTHQGADWTSPAALARLRDVPWPAFVPELDSLLAKETDPAVLTLLRQYREEDWDASRIAWDMGLADAWARKWDVRVIVNEFGDFKPFSPPAARAAWLHDMVSSLDRLHIAWTMWDYAGGFDLIDNVNGKRSIDPLVASALGLGEWSQPAPVREGPARLFTGIRPVQLGGETASATSPTSGDKRGFAEAMLPTDINGDGRLDLLVTSIDWPGLSPHEVRLFLNSPGGLLEPAAFDGPAPAGRLISSIVPGRFDRSGRGGFFLPDSGQPDGPGSRSILLLPSGPATLRAASANLPPETAHTTGAVAGDVDGDGADDLVVFHPYPGDGLGMELYRNDGTGHFQVDHRAFPAWMSNASADDNRFVCGTFVHRTGHPAPDLMVFGWGATNARVLFNDGHGHFRDGALLPAAPPNGGPAPGGCAVNIGDDVIAGFTRDASHPDAIQYLAGNGDGTYRDETASHLAPLPASQTGLHRIALQGKTLVLTRTAEAPIIREEGQGGVFTDVLSPQGNSWPWVVAPADLNGDGRLDLIFGQGTDSSILARFGLVRSGLQ